MRARRSNTWLRARDESSLSIATVVPFLFCPFLSFCPSCQGPQPVLGGAKILSLCFFIVVCYLIDNDCVHQQIICSNSP